MSKELAPFKSQKTRLEEQNQKPSLLKKQFTQYQKIRKLESKYLRGKTSRVAD